MAWSDWLSLLSYLGEDNNAHGGKKHRSVQVGEWLPTLTNQSKFDALDPSRPPARALICTQKAALLMACGLLPFINMIYIEPMSRSPFAPGRYRRTALPALSGAPRPPVQAPVTFSVIPEVIPLAASSPRSPLSIAPTRKTLFLSFHVRGELVPKFSGPVQRSRNSH